MKTIPPPLETKKGWPWDMPVGGRQFSAATAWPRISVLMPSYNQKNFIEQAIRSVLCQGYPNVELIVIDGGSNDGTVEVIKYYEPWIARWVSEKDNGMAEALNKGFRYATGDLIGWQNTDDYYGPGALAACAQAAIEFPEYDIYHGRTYLVDTAGGSPSEIPSGEFRLLERAASFPLIDMPNQAAFIRRSALGAKNFVDETYKNGMDTELFARLILSGHKTKYVDGITGYYRIHENAKTFAAGSTSSREACRLCVETLKRTDLAHDLRRQLCKGFRKMLIALFRTGDTSNFLTYTRQYFQLRESEEIDFDLRIRMIISFAAPGLVKALLRRLYQRPE
ncbi:MAG TPA: glycosyltransferase family 2 protein [Bacteroidota bacterium]|nr:glycosyltransferase family 2 protein [Bacteroidota bacterium]